MVEQRRRVITAIGLWIESENLSDGCKRVVEESDQIDQIDGQSGRRESEQSNQLK